MKSIELVGQEEKLGQLMRLVQTGRIVHALLMKGQKGTGRHTAARLLAQTALCTGEDVPCGVCPACKQLREGIHPDLHIVEPDGTQIKIDAIRELISKLSLRPYAGDTHVVFIEQAERMNMASQNALLKTLETPPGNVMFFLFTDNDALLLPTIVSRCQPVRFYPLAPKKCAEVLESRGIPPLEAERLAGYGRGCVGRALELKDDEKFFPLREKIISALETQLQQDNTFNTAAVFFSEKNSEESVLEILELWARDLMAVQNGLTPFQSDELSRLKRSKINGKKLLECSMQLRLERKSNVSWLNAVDHMLFKLTD